VVGVDERTDVAVIKIDGKNLPTVRIGDATKLKPGEWVIAIGSPFGFENSVHRGHRERHRALDAGESNFAPFIQTDVAVNPGNSGGPLFNLKGEVVGINSQIYSRTGGYMGLSFAVPIDIANNVVSSSLSNGKVTRSRIGVSIQDVDAQLADSFGLDRPRGALVGMVESDGPGREGRHQGRRRHPQGERPTDRDLAHRCRACRRKKPGSAVEDRGLARTASNNADVRAEADRGKSEQGGPDAQQRRRLRKLGLAVRRCTQQEKRQAETEANLLVEDVEGPAAGRGVSRRHHPRRERQQVKSVEELQDAPRSATARWWRC
jgi:serine protease Do